MWSGFNLHPGQVVASLEKKLQMIIGSFKQAENSMDEIFKKSYETSLGIC